MAKGTPLQPLNAVFKKTTIYVDKQGSRYLQRESLARRGDVCFMESWGGLGCCFLCLEWSVCCSGFLTRPVSFWKSGSREETVLQNLSFHILSLHLVSSMASCFVSQELFRSLVQMCLSQEMKVKTPIWFPPLKCKLIASTWPSCCGFHTALCCSFSVYLFVFLVFPPSWSLKIRLGPVIPVHLTQKKPLNIFKSMGYDIWRGFQIETIEGGGASKPIVPTHFGNV